MRTRHFERWLTFVFDRKIARSRETWAQRVVDESSVRWTGPPARLGAFLTRLFRDPVDHLDRFTHPQIAEGLWFIAFATLSGYSDVVLADSQPSASRVALIESTLTLFEKGFAQWCAGELGGAAPPDSIECTCYMWWDLFESGSKRGYGDPSNPAYREQDAATLNVMRRLLELPSPHCQQSALHGLRHWRASYPLEVNAIIDHALSRGGLDPRLRLYAIEGARGSGSF